MAVIGLRKSGAGAWRRSLAALWPGLVGSIGKHLGEGPSLGRDPAESDVLVVGYLDLALGVGEAGRRTLRSLAGTGLHVQGLAISLNSSSSMIDTDCRALLTEKSTAPIQIFVVNADQIAAVLHHLQGRIQDDAYRIIVPFWELAQLPDAWLSAYDLVDEVWAATRFMQQALLQKIKKPVTHMPLMLDFKPPPPVDRSRFNLPRNQFLFFFAFDYLSFIERKNPQAVLEAFKRAFRRPGQTRPAMLVLKTLNATQAPAKAQRLRALLANDPDVILIEETLSDAETLGLIGACDCVVSLHRSEGLGLLVAEAMVIRKPVIATAYSATTELINAKTGYPVEYRLIPVTEGDYPFASGQVWADADVDRAASRMTQVLEGGAEVAARVAAAKRHIELDHGNSAVARCQLSRLRALQRLRCCA